MYRSGGRHRRNKLNNAWRAQCTYQTSPNRIARLKPQLPKKRSVALIADGLTIMDLELASIVVNRAFRHWTGPKWSGCAGALPPRRATHEKVRRWRAKIAPSSRSRHQKPLAGVQILASLDSKRTPCNLFRDVEARKHFRKSMFCWGLFWWTWTGSNRRPLPCHGSALPTAPQAHPCGRPASLGALQGYWSVTEYSTPARRSAN